MQIFADKDSVSAVGRLDPRARVAAAFALALFIVTLRHWPALAAAALLVLMLAAAARAFTRATLRRLTELNVFALFLLVFTPLSVPGPPALAVGGLAWSLEGVHFALRIAAKANLVMLVCSALLANMEPSVLAHALHRLKLPAKLVHMLFFCIRYLEALHLEYHRLRNAMRLRAFRPGCNRHALRSFGYLVGMLFVRSCDRADRIMEAMKCRGFQGRLYSLAEFAPGPRDAIFAAALALACAAIGAIEWGA